MYSLQTSLIILGMVITGTARSVGVKIFYQLGCDNPLLIALLYLVGQSLSLVVHGVTKCTSARDDHDYAPLDPKDQPEVDDHNSDYSTGEDDSSDELSELELQLVEVFQDDDDEEGTNTILKHSQSDPIPDHTGYDENDEIDIPAVLRHSQSLPAELSPTPVIPKTQRRKRRGSHTGLTQESQQAVAWIHSIPWQSKPLIPGLFNLANAALKWASFVFVAASIAEMLMSGLELVLSVIVAKLVRKRQISRERWMGVFVVAIGLSVVHAADLWNTTSDDTEDGADRRTHWIGALLIVGQCATAVGQDIAEELFLQESGFPATLLLGMEGVFGLLFGVPLYLRYTPEPPQATLANLQASEWKMIYICILVIVFTVTGIFNITTTAVTSSMTRNMWKNCRTLMVWIVGLIVFYSLGDDNLGEEWFIPDSFFVLGGFLIMLSGIYVYYKNK